MFFRTLRAKFARLFRLSTHPALPHAAEKHLAEVDWGTSEVMVGSLRTEGQYRINLAKKFYYAPVKNVASESMPVRYIALCRQKSWPRSGILYYGEIAKMSRVKRSSIPVPMRPNSGDEEYYLFRIKRWIRLPRTVRIKKEGVYMPRFTNLYLLRNCRYSFELFHIHNALQFRLMYVLRRFSEKGIENDRSGIKKFVMSLGDVHSLWTSNGNLLLCNAKGEALADFTAMELVRDHGAAFELILTIAKL